MEFEFKKRLIALGIRFEPQAYPLFNVTSRGWYWEAKLADPCEEIVDAYTASFLTQGPFDSFTQAYDNFTTVLEDKVKRSVWEV